MFAYGTAIITVLEFDRSATIAELALPIACSVMSLYVAFRCWKKAILINPKRWWPNDWWPEDRIDKLSLVTDLTVTFVYVMVWVLVLVGAFSTDTRAGVALFFLIIEGPATIIPFLPIIRETIKHPQKERSLPWLVWTIAYGTLVYATYLNNGLVSELLIYPAVCVLLHFLMAIISSGFYRKLHAGRVQ